MFGWHYEDEDVYDGLCFMIDLLLTCCYCYVSGIRSTFLLFYWREGYLLQIWLKFCHNPLSNDSTRNQRYLHPFIFLRQKCGGCGTCFESGSSNARPFLVLVFLAWLVLSFFETEFLMKIILWCIRKLLISFNHVTHTMYAGPLSSG